MKRLLLPIVSLITISALVFSGCTNQTAKPTGSNEEPTTPSDQEAVSPEDYEVFTFKLGGKGYTLVTVKEINEIMGVPVPIPTYLPEGYKIQEIYIAEMEHVLPNNVLLLISDEEIIHNGQNATAEIVFSITYCCGPGLKMPWAQGFRLLEEPQVYGYFVSDEERTGGDHNEVWYQWFYQTIDVPEEDCRCFDIKISAGTNIPQVELANIAKSMPY